MLLARLGLDAGINLDQASGRFGDFIYVWAHVCVRFGIHESGSCTVRLEGSTNRV